MRVSHDLCRAGTRASPLAPPDLPTVGPAPKPPEPPKAPEPSDSSRSANGGSTDAGAHAPVVPARGDDRGTRACYHLAVVYVLLGLLALVVLAAPIDDVHPIEIKPEHEALAWSVELQVQETSGRAKAWIGRMGERPLFTLFAVDLDEEAAPTAEGETPLLGLAPGTYDLHYESDGGWWVFSLVGR